jgi:hypothetical protein
MKKTILLGLLTVVLVTAGWWLYTGPQRTLAAIKVAADTNNEAAFRKLVDVPAMQADLLAQLLGPPDPNAGPIFVNGLSMLGLNQTATPRGMQSYLQDYQAPILGLWGGQGGAGRYTSINRYLFATPLSAAGEAGSTLVLERQGLRWRLVTVKIPQTESVPVTTGP